MALSEEERSLVECTVELTGLRKKYSELKKLFYVQSGAAIGTIATFTILYYVDKAC